MLSFIDETVLRRALARAFFAFWTTSLGRHFRPEISIVSLKIRMNG